MLKRTQLLFDAEDISALMTRPADAVESLQLMGPETAEARVRGWWKDLYERYHRDVLEQLKHILSSSKTRQAQIEAMQSFLSVHHAFIQGSCLDYLAIPTHPVSLTLSFIAQRLEEATNIPAIELLMPGVWLESGKGNVVDLSKLPLSFALQSHIALSSECLMPVASLLEYIEDPSAPFYSPYTNGYDYKEASSADIEALFNHSPLTQQLRDAFQAYQHLTTSKESLLGQLNLLGQRLRLYDAHGGVGRADNAAGGAYSAIIDFMKYYLLLEPCELRIQDTPPTIDDLEAGHHLGYVFYQDQLYFLSRYGNEGVIKPLTSPERPAKFSVRLVTVAALEDIPDSIAEPCIAKVRDTFVFLPGRKLLAPAKIGCISINFPREFGRVISLDASNVPSSVFEAIAATGFTAPKFATRFRERFHASKRLTTEDLAFIDVHAEHFFMSDYPRIPKELSDEIELLWQLSHHPAKNIDATRNMATCIGTRGEALRALTKQHESALSKVGIHAELQATLIREAKATLEHLQGEFKQQLRAQTYVGHDGRLGLTLPMLARYQKAITIQSVADCYQLACFTPEDLTTFLDEELIQAIRTQLSSLEDYIVYLSATPLSTLKVVLPHTISKLKYAWQLLPQLLEIVGNEKGHLLFSQLPSVIQTADDFSDVLYYLMPEQRTVVLEAMKEKLPGVINTVDDFRRVLWYLTPEQSTVVCATMKEKLSGVINTAGDFGWVLQYLTPEQCTVVCVTMKEMLSVLIKTAGDFFQVLRHPTPERCTAVCATMKEKLSELIKTADDFRSVLRHLTPERCTVVCATMKEKLSELIKTVCDFGLVLYELTPEQRTVVYEAMKERLPALINTVDDFGWVLYYLTPEQRTVVCEAMKEKLPGLIKRTYDFSSVLRHLTPEQCRVVCATMKENLPGVINTVDDFRQVLYCLTPEQCTVVCVTTKKKLSELIKTAGDFGWVLQYLTPEQCTAVCATMKENLPGVIKTADDFRSVLRHLTPERCTVVCATMKEKLPALINTVDDFGLVLYELTPEQRTVVYEAVKERLPVLIKTARDFGWVLYYLTPEQRAVVCVTMKEKLPALINTVDDFGLVLYCLTPEQRAVVCVTMKEKLSELINTADGFSRALKYLTPEQCRVVCVTMKEKRPEVIKTAGDFGSVLFYLTLEQCTVVCVTMKEKLSELIKTADDFSQVLRYITPEQRAVIYEAMKERTSGVINTPDDFGEVLYYLTPEQRTVVYETVKERLPDLIKTAADLRKVSGRNYRKPELIAKEVISVMLSKYTERVESTTKDGAIDFSHGFWFFKQSRGVSRKINYLIARHLLETLGSDSNISFSMDVISKIVSEGKSSAQAKLTDEERQHLLGTLDSDSNISFSMDVISKIVSEGKSSAQAKLTDEERQHYVDRGMNSSELNAVIDIAKSFER